MKIETLNNSIQTAIEKNYQAQLVPSKKHGFMYRLPCPDCKATAYIKSDLVLNCKTCGKTTLCDLLAKVNLSTTLNTLFKSDVYMNKHNDKEYSFINTKTGSVDTEISIKAIKEILGWDLYNQWKQRVHFVEFAYNPQNAIFDGNSYNNYNPPSWKRDLFFWNKPVTKLAKCPDLYAGFFKHLVGQDALYLVDWLTQGLQSKPQQYLILLGEGGIGKGVLGEIAKRLHGEPNYSEVSNAQFNSKSTFNGYMKDKTFIYLNEISITKGDTSTIDKLKSLVDPTLQIEQKGVDAKVYNNFASIYITSNRLNFPIEHDERRYSFLHTTDVKLAEYAETQGMELKQFIDELYKPENITQLAQFLFNRKTKSNMNVSYKNQNKMEEILDENLGDTWRPYVIRVLANREAGKQINMKDVQQELDGVFEKNKNYKQPGRLAFKDLAKQTAEKYFSLHQRKGSGEYYLKFNDADNVVELFEEAV